MDGSSIASRSRSQAPTLKTIPAPPTAAGQPGTVTRAFLSVFGGAVCIGFAPIFVRLSEVGPVATAFWRMALSLPLIWLLLAVNGRAATANEHRGDRRIVEGWPIAVVGLFFAADLAVWHWSLHFTTVANSTLLANFAPVFVVLFGWAVFGQRVSRRFLLAMAVALVGTCLLIGRDFRLDRRALLGDGLSLATAFFYAGYLLSMKASRGRFGTLIILAYSGIIAALILFPVALGSGERILPATAHGWLVLVALALIVHAGGQGLIAYGIGRLPAAVASVSLLVQPLTAALAAAVILHEPVAPLQALGVALVLAGVFVARQEGL